MKNAKIVLVAEWDGWCAGCATERPLVLTRTGRLGLRSWLTGGRDNGQQLTMTCRLCGISVLVPAEEDDPPVLTAEQDDPPVLTAEQDASDLPEAARAGAAPLHDLLPTPSGPVPALAAAAAVAPTPATSDQAAPPEPTAGLGDARRAVGAALAALVAQRTAQATPPMAVPLLGDPPAAAHVLPLQRTAPADTDSLAALHLLADGIDLLGAGRP